MNMETDPTVFVVDDDAAVRESLQWLIKTAGLNVECYGTAQEFLDVYDKSRPGCLVLDVRMPGLSGLDLQEQLGALGMTLPVIIITGHGEVPLAVRAMKGGAIDFLEKPFSDQLLLDRIREAIAKDEQDRQEQARRAQAAERLALLTPREREVMAMVVDGKANKQIAASLQISQKTVEAHRAQVMRKMEAGSVAELVRLAQAAGA
jgi:RNA polymerase sigma factor (sigma-70 family)